VFLNIYEQTFQPIGLAVSPGNSSREMIPIGFKGQSHEKSVRDYDFDLIETKVRQQILKA
jgi:hypothetical protein